MDDITSNVTLECYMIKVTCWSMLPDGDEGDGNDDDGDGGDRRLALAKLS